MSYSSSSDETMIAAYLEKPGAARGVTRGRKELLVFPGRVRRPALFTSLPPEPEDAILTGGTRSLHRRLLALNLYPAARMAVASILPTPQPGAKIA